MKQLQREFIKICIANGFYYSRYNGDHAIHVNDKGRYIGTSSNLKVDTKKLKKEEKDE